MSMPFYVSPEQVMQDKAEYARKGVSRGKSSVTLEYAEGVLLLAENYSPLQAIQQKMFPRLKHKATVQVRLSM